MAGQEVKGTMTRRAGPTRKFTSLESWRLAEAGMKGAVSPSAGVSRKLTNLEF